MPYPEIKAILTDIGTEELGHLEMVGTIVYQLTRNLSVDEIKQQGFEDYFVDHTTGVYPSASNGMPFTAAALQVKGDLITDLHEDVYPSASNGMPFTAAALQVKGDLITDLHEDLAAEQKARTTYDNILRFCDDYDVRDAIRFLRAREIVHYQRFGEGLRLVTDKLDSKNFYAFNPSFDQKRPSV